MPTTATKDLSALGSVIEMEVSGLEKLTRGGFHYIQGTGTILLECTMQVGSDANWIPVVDDSDVAIAAITAVGVTSFPINGYARVRARNTVAGAGNLCALGLS